MKLVERAETDRVVVPAHVRIGTWNVNEAIALGSGEDTLPEIVRIVREQRLDMLALQEVPFLGRSEVSPLFGPLLSETQLSHVAGHSLSPSYVRPGGRSGVVVASRFPLGEITRAVLPNPGLVSDEMHSFDKGTVMARITLGGCGITLASVHMFPFHRFQRCAEEPEFSVVWDHLADEVSRCKDDVVVVAGDFNTDQRSLVLGRLAVPMESAITEGQVDDVLFGGARLVTVATVPTSSDHPLCVAELDLTREQVAAA
ncbi:endonuclease/exonuclease/phosphatase family protein [Sphaerisporangium sp. B11E5]|uniref:endonuclease/exonuclease/phosphatase family protein n=1 Tax=Sphaerisporangium sp. B11E5 TaxID=3153563 RepID=UPI00325C3CAC